jgi:membrane fusion protein, copper/silver efflux system
MKRSRAVVALVVLAAAAAGFLLGRGTKPTQDGRAAPSESPLAGGQVYTCSMHPQVRLDRPGTCPICEMPLIPAAAAEQGTGGPPMLQLSEHARAMASVATTPVRRRELERVLRAVGKIEYDETSLATVTARVAGYAERLFADVTGVEIQAGDHLAELYSPELIIGQQELLIALQGGAGAQIEPLVEAAKLKLRRWGMNDAQIAELVEDQRITDRVTLYSPIRGTVIERSIVENSFFEAGDVLYRVADLGTVWVDLDVYELDVPWIRYGQRVEITAEALPGRVFEGLVTFVRPIVDEGTRTVKVPVHIDNADHSLKPGMFVSASVVSKLGADGRAAPTGVEGKFTCPMHPQVLRDGAGQCPLCEMNLAVIPGGAPSAPPEAATRYRCPMDCEHGKTYAEPGSCPVCGMKLEQVAPQPPAGGEALAVPIGAVLDSGTRRLAYVEKSRGLFEPRELVLGPRAGGFFPVLDGLSEGELVVVRGGFLIDSQFQITGHPSLFHPGGAQASAGHEHAGGAPAQAPPTSEPPAPPKPHEH